MASATKTSTVLTNWTAVPISTVKVSTEANLLTSLSASIKVTITHSDTNANALGLLVTVQAKYGNDWSNLYPPIRMGAGTADGVTLNAEAASGQKVIPLSATTDFEVLGDRAWIDDGADSEVVIIAGFDTGVSITALVNLINTHANSTPILSNVADKTFTILDSIGNVRVIVLNDDDNAGMYYQVSKTAMIAIG